MVAVTSNLAPPAAVDTPHTAVGTPTPARRIGLVPTASMITGAAVAAVWLWIPLTILVVGISSIPSVVGFAIAVVVFVYLMRGVQWLERIRSEAVFSMGIGVPAAQHLPLHRLSAVAAPALAGYQQRTVLEGFGASLPARGLRRRSDRHRLRPSGFRVHRTCRSDRDQAE